MDVVCYCCGYVLLLVDCGGLLELLLCRYCGFDCYAV